MKKSTNPKRYWRWGLLVFIVFGAVILARSFKAEKKVGLRDPVIERHDLRIAELKRQAKNFSESMGEAESTKDKIRYLDIVKKLAVNQIELDREWKALHESLRIRQLGKQAGSKAAGTLMTAFTEQEKLEMLAKEYSLNPESLRFLKAEIGILFSDEFRGRTLEEIHDTLAFEGTDDF